MDNSEQVTDLSSQDELDFYKYLEAYDTGMDHCQKNMMKFIEAWKGETNSSLGALLLKKFKELKL